jgi:hypothetical protein
MRRKPTDQPVQKSAPQSEHELHEIEEMAESSNPKDPSPEIARDRQVMPPELHHRGAKPGPRHPHADDDSRH